MVKLVHMNMFFGFMLFMICLFTSFGSSNMTSEKYVNNVLGDHYFVKHDVHEYKPVGAEIELPKLEYVKDSEGGYYYASCSDFPKVDGQEKYIFDQQYKDEKTNKVLNIKFVYELNYLENAKIENPAIPEHFQGTYSFANEGKHIVEVSAKGTVYYDGEKINASYDENAKTVSGSSSKFEITISKVEDKYNINVLNKTDSKSFSATNVVRTLASSNLQHFDFNSYMNEKEEVVEDVDDVLIIYTKTLVYYMYNRGYAPLEGSEDYNYLTVPNKNGIPQHPIHKYYLPDSPYETKLTPDKWTKEAKPGETVEIEGEVYTAHKGKLIDSLAEVFAANSPVLTYNYAKYVNIDILNQNPLTISKIWTDYNVKSWASSYELQTTCTTGLFFGFLLPLLCITITWLMSRKKGNLKMFKEYFNLAAIAFIPIAIINFIVGFFIQYGVFIYFTVVLQLGYYIFVAYRINTMKKAAPENYTSTEKYTAPLKVEEVEETNDEDSQTPNLIG